MHHMTNTKIWLDTLTNGESIRAVAARSDLEHTSLSRWCRLDRIPADAVVLIARAYNASPVLALVSYGVLTPTELMAVRAGATLADASNEALVDELTNRINVEPGRQAAAPSQPSLGPSMMLAGI